MEKDIRFLVTNKCNYNCVFCHNEGQEKVIPDKELDVDLLYPSTMTKFIIEFKNGQKFSIEIKERKR